VYALAMAAASACSDPMPGDGGLDVEADAPPTAMCMDGSVTVDPNDAGGMCPVIGRDESACADLVTGFGRDGTFDDFVAFAPRDTVWIAIGSQGLQHIVVALHGRGFSAVNPLVGLRFVLADTCESLGYLRFRLPFTPDTGDPTLLRLQAQRVVLLNDRDPLQYCDAIDRDVILLADLDDLHGHRAHREIRLHVGGIDPMARPDLRQAWIDACARRDGGTDASAEASTDVATDASLDAGFDR
jgi:hypothetical protein